MVIRAVGYRENLGRVPGPVLGVMGTQAGLECLSGDKWGKGGLSSRYKGPGLKEKGTFRKLQIPWGQNESEASGLEEGKGERKMGWGAL